ncbi:Muconate cycloisomerase [Sphingobium yanoikuyae]|uniref:Muconate cycloisomerase n=1 Tax=Sphingobium yanoikuyae TaxID=13690 RepID=A0A084E239_SPHYA|nr:muconate/chloromuconate family cycloisomerase [Sphingobium yanoikuyae]KEZ12031.1 Muconate cycloisomerase [Sphingobium yanoikuyae]
MVTIETIETFIVDVPTIRQHVLAMATMRTQAMVFVHVRCSDGVEGIGEGTTIGGLSYGDESPEGIKLTIDRHVAPLLHGSDASPARATMLLRKSIVGNHFAKNAVETALFDAAGKRAGVPVSELLGGRVRDRLPVLWTLASGDTARDIAEAETMIDQRRHKAFKLKIGKRDLVEDVAHVAAIKRALGDQASIRVDVNQAWDEATAKRGVAMLADADVDLIEQPISGANVSGMARLTAMGRTAIMADEGLRGPIDALRHATDAAADVFAVKIAQSGGLRAGAAVAGIAEVAGIGLYGGTMLEGPIGSIASAHLFATFAGLAFGTELFGPLLLAEDLLAEPLDYTEFSLAVPSGPGLGLTLDMEKVRAFRRDGDRRTVISISKAVGA